MHISVENIGWALFGIFILGFTIYAAYVLIKMYREFFADKNK